MKPPRPRESGGGGGNTSANRTQFADDVVEPLLNKDAITVATVANSDTDSLDSDNVRYKPTNAQLFKAGVVLAVSSAGVAASVASFFLSPEIFVYIAGGICCLHFPFVVYRERKILKLPALRKTVNELRESADALKDEIGLLEEDIDYMTYECSRYDGVERELKAIVKNQGHSVDNVVMLVRQNEEIMDLMRDNLRHKVIQDVIRITVTSDRHNTQRIDRVEAKLLALKICVQLESYAITFDEDKFLQAVALNPTLWGVIMTVRKLIPMDEYYEGEVSDDADDSDYSVSGVSRTSRYSLEDEHDLYDMFYLNDDVEQGRASVAGAHSSKRRVSLACNRESDLSGGTARRGSLSCDKDKAYRRSSSKQMSWSRGRRNARRSSSGL